MFAGNYAPEGWALCDGSILLISGNETLFSLIGATYGGDGKTNFGLPDLRGRVPVGMGTGAAGTAYAVGQQGGSETAPLAVSQIPVHAHALSACACTATEASPVNHYLAQSVNGGGGSAEDAFYLPTSAPVRESYLLNQQALSMAGGGLPHANIMPCFGINFIIALNGEYPRFE